MVISATRDNRSFKMLQSGLPSSAPRRRFESAFSSFRTPGLTYAMSEWLNDDNSKVYSNSSLNRMLSNDKSECPLVSWTFDDDDDAPRASEMAERNCFNLDSYRARRFVRWNFKFMCSSRLSFLCQSRFAGVLEFSDKQEDARKEKFLLGIFWLLATSSFDFHRSEGTKKGKQASPMCGFSGKNVQLHMIASASWLKDEKSADVRWQNVKGNSSSSSSSEQQKKE